MLLSLPLFLRGPLAQRWHLLLPHESAEWEDWRAEGLTGAHPTGPASNGWRVGTKESSNVGLSASWVVSLEGRGYGLVACT